MRLFVVLFFIQLYSHAQSIRACQQRFNAYLNFKGSLNSVVKFEDDAIYLMNNKGDKEFAVYSHELDMLAEFFENNSFTQQEQLLKLKGTKRYTKRQRDSLYIYIDEVKKPSKQKKAKPLAGFRVAIDPGHFGTTLEEAKIEQKFLYFALDSLKKDSIKLFESELNFVTAILLKKQLENQGAKVLLTREKANHTSFGCSYFYWIKQHKNRVLDSLEQTNNLSEEKAEKLKKLSDYKFFWDFFRDYDLINRAKKINEFKPHATAIVHYNVDEKNEGWNKVTNKNFTMTFIGGAITETNLDKPETKIHFLRLLLTKQLNQSEQLSGFTVQNFSKLLTIPIANISDATYLRENCLPTQSNGVFVRNLLLCRMVNSALVYGEALYQDNMNECKLLNSKTNANYESNQRLLAVANAYYEALYKFLKNY